MLTELSFFFFFFLFSPLAYNGAFKESRALIGGSDGSLPLGLGEDA